MRSVSVKFSMFIVTGSAVIRTAKVEMAVIRHGELADDAKLPNVISALIALANQVRFAETLTRSGRIVYDDDVN